MSQGVKSGSIGVIGLLVKAKIEQIHHRVRVRQRDEQGIINEETLSEGQSQSSKKQDESAQQTKSTLKCMQTF